VREIRTLGSAEGAQGNRRPYSNRRVHDGRNACSGSRGPGVHDRPDQLFTIAGIRTEHATGDASASAAVRRTTCHPIERRPTTRWHCGGRRTRSIQAWPGTTDNEPPACRIEWPTRPLRFPVREVRLPPRHLVRPVAQGRAVQGCLPIGAATMIVSLDAIFLSTFVMSSQKPVDVKRLVLVDHQWGGPRV
jgi:hypothetical protein